MKIRRDISTPIRTGLSWHETWAAEDRGLIKCWENGRTKAAADEELAAKCRAGELPPSAWKGGVSRQLKKREKFGSLNYLAEWQGLRGEGLNIDLDAERTITCTRTGMILTYTSDHSKYANQQIDNDDKGESSDGGPAPGVQEQSLFS